MPENDDVSMAREVLRLADDPRRSPLPWFWDLGTRQLIWKDTDNKLHGCNVIDYNYAGMAAKMIPLLARRVLGLEEAIQMCLDDCPTCGDDPRGLRCTMCQVLMIALQANDG